MDGQAHAARALWNLLHNWWTMTPQCRRSLAAADAAIRQARSEIDWMGQLPAQAAQAVLKTYWQAWRNCWEGRAEAPKFKARYRTVMSVDIPQGRDLHVVRVHRRWGMVNIPKVGRVRFRWTKDLPVGRRADNHNRITGARLVKDPLGWHIAFRIQSLDPAPSPHTGPPVGIDVGVTVPLALSDGNHQTHEEWKSTTDKPNAWITESEQTALRRLERRAAHKESFRKPGERASHRLQRTYDQIAGIRATAKRRHLDWQHKSTTKIARAYSVIVVEQLNITNMVKSAKGTIEAPGTNVAQKTGLNRSISQEAWGRTVTMLDYKTARHGGILAKVPAAGTSQRCSQCHTITPGSREAQALFVCKNPACGWTGNADHNASRNILHAHLYQISWPRHSDGPRAHPGCREGSREAPTTASNPPPRGRQESPAFRRKRTSS